MSDFFECRLPYAEDDGQIELQFEARFKSLGRPADVALYSRLTGDRKTIVFLVTPIAGLFTFDMPGRWVRCEDPFKYPWTFLAGSNSARSAFPSLVIH